MADETKAWLFDIFQSILEIESFIIDINRNFFEFRNDIKTKRAIERNLEIIGEAVNRVLNTNPLISLTNSRKIVDLRNRIIHNYDNISEEIIWGIIIKHLPKLKSEIEILLKD